MIPNKHGKSQLEIYLNPQMAGNSPQTSVGSSLLNVLISFSKLSDTIFLVTKSLPDSINSSWISISRQSSVMEEKLKIDFGTSEAFELTSLLNEIGRCSSILSGDVLNLQLKQALFTNYRQVLANMILYAKDFGDISFKNEVLSLVKRWEAIK